MSVAAFNLFLSQWTHLPEPHSGKQLQDKTVIVTGANSGTSITMSQLHKAKNFAGIGLAL